MLTRNSSVAEKASRLKVLDSIAREDWDIAESFSDIKTEIVNENVNSGDLMPSGDVENDCSSECRDCDFPLPSSQPISLLEERLCPIEQQLQYFLNQADDLQNHIVSRADHSHNEGLGHLVPTFIHTCQPYFTYLESTARNTVRQRTPLPFYIRSRLLNFSKQLCARLEQLVLSYANYKILSLDESAPNSISHFYVGHCQIDSCMKLAMFRYCQPAPFLAGVNTGLYKRMRWNVERLRDQQPMHTEGQTEQETEKNTVAQNTAAVDLEYYFLCYEDVPGEPPEGEREVQTVPRDRMWSIGQWVQTYPHPEGEDIDDWILCEVPHGQYHKLISLGGEEPSTCSATDCLMGALLCQQGPVESKGPGHIA